MEKLVVNKNFWKNRNVFITGHTGFKGGWTALCLSNLGANVYGYSLPPSIKNSFFLATRLKEHLKKSTFSNILDPETLLKEIKSSEASLIFHMAAQPLVSESYKNPLNTYKTNVIGTINIFEAARQLDFVKGIINVTSDKCYENFELMKPYRENDRLGGNDPYSSSKACAELVSNSYRKSFFTELDKYLATVRAGNVIGGGDYAEDRLIPDIFKALDNNKNLNLRSPNSIRPWQHVLEPVFGYLKLAEKLIKNKKKYAEAWNFGPHDTNNKSVLYIAKYFRKKFKNLKIHYDQKFIYKETKILKIDSTKSKSILGWKNIWNIDTALDKTIEWYMAQKANQDMCSVSLCQINSYSEKLKNYM